MSQNQQENSKSVRLIVLGVILYLVVIGVSVVAAYYLAPVIIPTPKIGVINITTPVDRLLAEVVSREINYALEARDIKGVVLVVHSPGGGGAESNDIYFQVRRLREEKPVVASVDSWALSGGYWVAVAANEIYAKSTSFVGSVGIGWVQPRPEILNEDFITTGPYKAIGGSAPAYHQKLNLMYADFRETVVVERSAAPNPLKISPNQLASGEIWTGIEGIEYGLIDKLGSKLDAIDAVARLAHLKNYEVVDVRDEYLASLEGEQYASALKLYENLGPEAEFGLTPEEVQWPSVYSIYIPLE